MTEVAPSFAAAGSKIVHSVSIQSKADNHYRDYAVQAYHTSTVTTTNHQMPHWRRQFVQDGPQAIPRLSPSRSKKEFLEHMGISEENEQDKRLYRDMMSEAAAARERMCSQRENLTHDAQNNPRVRPPYSSSMIKEDIQYREVQYIYNRALPHTKALYDKGNFMDGRNWDNWVIRWCLWHVFRYRDERNRNRGQRTIAVVSFEVGRDGTSTGGERSDDEQSYRTDDYRETSGPLSPRSPPSPRNSVYDPVRDSLLQGQSAPNYGTTSRPSDHFPK